MRIVFANEKGGCGKTTCAVNVAAGLAHIGRKVLLVDADAQGHSTILSGFQKAPGFYDLMVRGAQFSQVTRLVSHEVYEIPGNQVKGELYLIPGNIESSTISEKTSDLFALRDRLDELDGIVDDIVFDTSPTSTFLHGAIYLAAHVLFIPVMLDSFNFDGMVETIRRTEQTYIQRQGSGLRLAGIIPMAYNKRFKEEEYNLADIQEAYGETVWEPLPYSAMFRRAIRQSQTVFATAPNTKAAHDVTKLVARILVEVIHGKAAR